MHDHVVYFGEEITFWFKSKVSQVQPHFFNALNQIMPANL